MAEVVEVDRVIFSHSRGEEVEDIPPTNVLFRGLMMMEVTRLFQVLMETLMKTLPVLGATFVVTIVIRVHTPRKQELFPCMSDTR